MNNPADYISRYLLHDNCGNCYVSESCEDAICCMVQSSVPKALSMSEIKTATSQDPVLQTVMKSLESGNWTVSDSLHDAHAKDRFHKLNKVKDELSVTEDQVVARGDRLVIPVSLQAKVIDLAHEGHQGICKTKSLLRSKVWFPNLDKLCEETVRKCFKCQIATDVKTRDPLQMTVLPSGPWECISIDFAEVGGKYVLVVIDDYSRFPIAEVIHSTSASVVIPRLDKLFATFGVPGTLRSDNGPPFSSKDFKTFAETLGFKHKRVTPLWPEANGEAERFMRTLKRLLHTAGQDDWKAMLPTFMRNYHSTPHCTTGIAPAIAFFKRSFRNKLPQVSSNFHEGGETEVMRQRDNENKALMKSYADVHRKVAENNIEIGDNVFIRQKRVNKFSTPYSAVPLTVTDKKHSMITAENAQRRVTRNASFFKRVHPNTVLPMSQDPPSTDDVDSPLHVSHFNDVHGSSMMKEDVEPTECNTPRRSGRLISAPKRLIEEM